MNFPAWAVVLFLTPCAWGEIVWPDSLEAENDYYYDDTPLTVCYEDIGCFSSGYPFYDPPYRPVSWLPETRAEVGTHFYLNTRKNPHSANELLTSDKSTISNSYFDPLHDTKVIVHGFTQNGDVQWMYDMQESCLNLEDLNVIRVDWRGGAVGLYGKATANTRIVGAEISLLIDRIKDVFGMTSSLSFHIIGHSLGAHTAGYAGERQVDLGRITGMDPAGPYYEETDRIVRLDSTDAIFVDVMHTDTDPIYTLGMGIFTKCGHVDIYVNGGSMQPGCDQNIVEHIVTEGSLLIGGVQFVVCNHLRSYELFIESIDTQCPYTAMRCDAMSYQDYLDGQCFDQTQTISMGYNADSSAITTGETNVVYYMQTQDQAPHCGESYWVKFYMVDKFMNDDVKGLFYVTLFGTLGQTSKILLNEESKLFEHNKNYKFPALAEDYIGSLTGLYFEWSYDRDWYKPWEWDVFRPPFVYVSHIEVEYAEDQFRYLLCGVSDVKKDGIQADRDQTAFFVSTQCS